MKCVVCRLGETSSGVTTVTLTRGESTVVIKNVPADICDNCGEHYLSDPVSAQVMKLAEQAITYSVEVEVIPYAT